MDTIKTIIKFISETYKLIRYFFSVKQKMSCFFLENDFSREYIDYYILKKANRKKILILKNDKIRTTKHNNIYVISINFNFLVQLFFLFFNGKYVYSTTPDLNNTYFVKSIFNHVKYIYFHHSLISLNRGYRKDSFVNFDAIECCHEYHVNEVNEINEKLNKKIKAFKSKYKFLNKLKLKKKNFSYTKDLLIAPSWGTNFYDNNFYLFIKFLKMNNISFALRPHPMSLKNKEISIEKIKKYNIDICEEQIPNFYLYKNLITGYSGILIEYLLVLNKEPIIILEKKKLNNFKEKNSFTFEDKVIGKVEHKFNSLKDLCDKKNINKYFFQNKRNNIQNFIY